MIKGLFKRKCWIYIYTCHAQRITIKLFKVDFSYNCQRACVYKCWPLHDLVRYKTNVRNFTLYLWGMSWTHAQLHQSFKALMSPSNSFRSWGRPAFISSESRHLTKDYHVFFIEVMQNTEQSVWCTQTESLRKKKKLQQFQW